MNTWEKGIGSLVDPEAPEGEVSERTYQIIEGWAQALPEIIQQEGTMPIGRETVFEEFDRKRTTIEERDNKPVLQGQSLEEAIQEKFRTMWGDKELSAESKAQKIDRIRRTFLLQQISSSQLIEIIQNEPTKALDHTNNFYMVFNSKVAEKIQEQGKTKGIDTTYATLPYYLNDHYDQAWSKMCQALPQDVEAIMNFTDKRRQKEWISEEENNTAKQALANCAVYLHEKAHISPYLLIP